MSDTQNTPAPVNNEGENTTSTQKVSLWARLKDRKSRFNDDHPFAAEMGRQLAYGAAYLGGILAVATIYGAVTGKPSENSDDVPEIESAEDDILSDEE